MQHTILPHEDKGAIVIATINRPEKLKALNDDTLVELNQCFLDISNDPIELQT